MWNKKTVYFLGAFLFIISVVLIIYSNIERVNNSIETYGDLLEFDDYERTYTIEKKDNFYISRYGKIKISEWEKINAVDVRFAGVEDFLYEVDYYVEAISRYIGRPNWQDVYKEKHGEDFEFLIDFSFHNGASHVIGGYNHSKYLLLGIKLNKDFFDLDIPPIAHEILHLIAPYYDYSSLSLSEGLASFIQDEIGRNASLPNFGESIFLITKENLYGIDEAIISAIGTVGRPQDIDIMSDYVVRREYYTLSYSFSRYLIEKYGMRKFMELYEAEDIYLKYEELYDVKLEELRELWISYINEK